MEDKKHKDPWTTDSRVFMFHDPTGELGAAAQKGATIEQLRAMKPGAFVGQKEIVGNSGLDNGLIYLIELTTGINPTAVKLDSTHAKIGVGDQTAPVQTSQTQLEAERIGTSFHWLGQDAGFPQRDGKTMIFRASFLSGIALFAWQEWAVAFEITSGVRVLMNRKVENIGTKPEFDLWIFETGLTWA